MKKTMEEAKKPYRYCLVPNCKNTTRSAPDKVFFAIPRNAKVRKQWCRIMRRDEVSAISCLYCCEDHFNIKEDTANYVAYKIMKQQGKNIQLRLKKGVAPHIFMCKKQGKPPPVKGTGAIKVQKLTTINEALAEIAIKSGNVLEIGKPSPTNFNESSETSSEIETRCRICLDTNASIPVFHHSEGKEDIQMKFFQCFYQKIEDIHGYPQCICNACDDVIDSTMKFLKKYKYTCDILHSIFTRTVKNENGIIIKRERDVEDDETFDQYEMISEDNNEISNKHSNSSEDTNGSCLADRVHSDEKPHIKEENFVYSEIEIDISGNDNSEDVNIVGPEEKTAPANDLINANEKPELTQTLAKVKHLLVKTKRCKPRPMKRTREILHIDLNANSSDSGSTIIKDNVTNKMANKNPRLNETLKKVKHLLVKPGRRRKVLDVNADEIEVEKLRNSYKSDRTVNVKSYSKPITPNLEDFEEHVKKQKEDFEAQLNKFKSRSNTKSKSIKSDCKKKVCKATDAKSSNDLKLCHQCGVTCKKISDHVSGHHSKRFTCPYEGCGKNLSDAYKVKLHIKRTHLDRQYQCDVCAKKFAMKRDLELHIRAVHMKIRKINKISCEVCGRMYVSKQGKDEHVRSVHTGERPFICTICNKGFTSQKNLKDHERLHTGETPFKCPICDRGYPQKGNMLSHVKHNHRKKDIDSSLLSSLSSVVLKVMKE